MRAFLAAFSRWAATITFIALVTISFLDLLMSRLFYRGFPEAQRLVEHALLALAFFAALRATIERTHLALSTGSGGKITSFNRGLADSIAVGVNALLFCASLSLMFVGFEPGTKLLGLPIALWVSPMAIGFLLMAIAGIVLSSGLARLASIISLASGLFFGSTALLNLGYAVGFMPPALESIAGFAFSVAGTVHLPLIVALAAAAFFGVPLYAVLSGVAALLFLSSGSAIELIPSEAYNLLRNASMPAIPLFTIAGFILSDSGAGKRLVAVFRELFGWLPGGEAFAAVLVCTFFTTFTGANGVTILALGGILAYILVGSGAYDEDYAHGLLTASSSIGLLFPPSIAIILYAVNAQFMVQGEGSFTITDM
ncbi:MAG: TRAP transporter large permease subunit, partial [Spirochaetales bacterium]